MLSIIQLTESKESDQIFTGDVYNIYNELCQKCKTEILTQRRVSDIIAEIDMLGLINARVVSKGRHGRTKEIKLSVPENILAKVKALLNESLEI